MLKLHYFLPTPLQLLQKSRLPAALISSLHHKNWKHNHQIYQRCQVFYLSFCPLWFWCWKAFWCFMRHQLPAPRPRSHTRPVCQVAICDLHTPKFHPNCGASICGGAGGPGSARRRMQITRGDYLDHRLLIDAVLINRSPFIYLSGAPFIGGRSFGRLSSPSEIWGSYYHLLWDGLSQLQHKMVVFLTTKIVLSKN